MNDLWHARYRLAAIDGDAHELAVALRRALLTSVEAAAVSTVRIKDAPHEFSVLPGMKEDVLELVLNLSRAKLKIEGPGPVCFEINRRGPCDVTAADVGALGVTEVVNADHHVATLDAGGWLVLSGEIVKGKGYRQAPWGARPGTIHLDCNFSPVKRAVCAAESDAIVVSLATDGRATPREALTQAVQAIGCASAAIEELEPAHQKPPVEPSATDYTKCEDRLPLPPLVGMHQAAYSKFIDEELMGAIGEVFPIAASDGSAELDLLAAKVEPPTISADDAIDRKETLAGRLMVRLVLRGASVPTTEEREICLGEVPWMTERETFVVHGVERIIVPTFQVGPDQQDAGLTRYPVRFLRALTDPLRDGLAQAQSVIGELLAHSDEFDLSSIADFLPIGKLLTESLGRHPCSQAIEATNPLDSLTHLRRASALGPGNIAREHAGRIIRGVDPGHYGRLCYVETPEGVNIGLVNSLALYAEIDADGTIRTPYFKAENGTVSDEVERLTAAQEQDAVICGCDVQLDEGGEILDAEVSARCNGRIVTVPATDVQYMEVSPIQALGPSASLVPFLAHDDVNRALMGANMQRQAVPLLWGEAPIVCSGTEERLAQASRATAMTKRGSGSSCDQGRLALGRNLLVAYMPWEGYNFEDAIVVSDRLVKDNVLTSVSALRFGLEAYATPEGKEGIARPAGAPDTLDQRGVVMPGVYVKPGDILVGKVHRRGDEAEDRSFKTPRGISGRILRTHYRSTGNGDVLPEGVIEAVDVEIADLRRAEAGDKTANRHGGKGVIGKIVSEQDMPYLPDGSPVDVLLSPLGVPPRMNLGQVLETHLGWAAATLNRRMIAPPFFGATVEDIEAASVEAGLPKSGTTVLYDGRNGRRFDSEITVGYLYVMKLDHMAADKIHARSTGPYSLLTQQPIGTRARFNGQRFGEMEVWAAEAHGARHVLQELLTVKSDDVPGRAALREALPEGRANVEPADTPHAFKTLMAQLKGVGFELEAPQPNKITSIRLSLASPDTIRSWSSGEVTRSTLIDERSGAPAEGGIFCENIFGPEAIRTTTESGRNIESVADPREPLGPERMGHIELAVPVCHPWLFHAVPELIAALLGIDEECLDDVVYYRKTIVAMPSGEKRVLSASEAASLLGSEPDVVNVGTGAAAIKKLLQEADVLETAERLSSDILKALHEAGNRAEWLVLDTVPVIAPAYRPMIRMPDGSLLSSDLNELYVRLIARNEACRQAIQQGAPEIIVHEKARGVQEAVDMLFGNGVKRGHTGPEHARARLASLSDMIRGQGGSVREIGKRVDFSGRSVIVPGPELKLTQCGLPREMARELFRPFVVSKLVQTGAAPDGAEAADRALAEAMQGRLVIINRAPTMHRHGLQAFEPVLTEHKGIALHPLVCRGFNADFDGDQVAVHLPLSDAAQSEARELMTPVTNLLCAGSGKPIVFPSQDIVLGLHYLTLARKDAKGAGSEFPSTAATVEAYESGDVALQAPVTVAHESESIVTTAGRIIFNSILPEDWDFVNDTADQRSLTDLVAAIHVKHDPEVTAETLDRMKELGFRHATQYGASIGKDALKLYSGKVDILSRVRSEAGAIKEEADERLPELWANAADEIGKGAIEQLAADMDSLNPVHLMHTSGARGSAMQLRQLCGMRGLMRGPESQVNPPMPITASFIEGHAPLEHFVSAYGARQGLVDTAVKTADAGYLMRKLVVRAQDVFVDEEDCGTEQCTQLEPLRDDHGNIIEDIAERALGRIAAESVVDPRSGEEIVAAGQLIDWATSEKLQAAGIQKLNARSVLCCVTEAGVCAKCYGSDLATGRLAKVGHAVGIVAAQAVGEPTIQLTMRTFYGWVPASRRPPKSTKGGLPRLDELERTGAAIEPGELVRHMTSIFREQSVRIHDKHFEIIAHALHRPIPKGFLSRALCPSPGESQIGILAKAALRGETDCCLRRRVP